MDDPGRSRVYELDMRMAKKLDIKSMKQLSPDNAEIRLCPCGGIQEEHIIMSCPKTHALRTALSEQPIFPDILHKTDIESFKYIHEVLNFDYNS